MENLETFKKSFKEHLENTWNTSDEETPEGKLRDTEITIKEYIKEYFKEVKPTKSQNNKVTIEAQFILDEFTESKKLL